MWYILIYYLLERIRKQFHLCKNKCTRIRTHLAAYSYLEVTETYFQHNHLNQPNYPKFISKVAFVIKYLCFSSFHYKTHQR